MIKFNYYIKHFTLFLDPKSNKSFIANIFKLYRETQLYCKLLSVGSYYDISLSYHMI